MARARLPGEPARRVILGPGNYQQMALDFHLVTQTLLKRLSEEQINVALIGGFALGFWGVTRATVDIDLLLLADDAEKADTILLEFGYSATYKTKNVAQYVASDVRFGNIDLIYAFRDVSKSMLSRSMPIQVAADVTIKSLVPEDIIGLKLQALVNDPGRMTRDMADIESLLAAKRHRGQTIDWQLLQDYFDLFDKSDVLEALIRLYG